MEFQKKIEEIKSGKLSPIYIVQGKEDYLQNWARQVFLESVVAPEDQELNVARFNMEETAVQTAIEDAESVPFFGDRRLVMIDKPYFLTGEKEKAKIEKPLSTNDIIWSIYNKHSLKYFYAKDFGLYRNTVFEMANFLKKEERNKQALLFELKGLYCDLSGKSNNNSTEPKEMLFIVNVNNIFKLKDYFSSEMLDNCWQVEFPFHYCNKRIFSDIVLDIFNGVSGDEILENNEINREKLGKLVFGNDDNLKILNSIIHPKIKELILKLQEEHKDEDLVFLDIALLYEANFVDLVEKVAVVYVDKAVQLERLMTRNSLSKEEALKRIESQMSPREKASLGDFVINNSSSKEDAFQQIDEILEKLKRGDKHND